MRASELMAALVCAGWSVVPVFDGGRWMSDGLGGRVWVDGPQLGVAAVAPIARRRVLPYITATFYDDGAVRLTGLESSRLFRMA